MLKRWEEGRRCARSIGSAASDCRLPLQGRGGGFRERREKTVRLLADRAQDMRIRFGCSPSPDIRIVLSAIKVSS